MMYVYLALQKLRCETVEDRLAERICRNKRGHIWFFILFWNNIFYSLQNYIREFTFPLCLHIFPNKNRQKFVRDDLFCVFCLVNEWKSYECERVRIKAVLAAINYQLIGKMRATDETMLNVFNSLSHMLR